MRKLFLENIPRKGTQRYNWEKSKGCIVHFIYDDIEDDLEIIQYKDKNIIIYNKVYGEFKILTTNFIKCKLSNWLNIKTSSFKVRIGQVFKDEKRDLIIIDREYRKRYNKNNEFKCNEKWYKYHCNKCGNEDWIREYQLLKNVGCNVCGNVCKKVIKGINDIGTTHKNLIKFFNNKDEAYKYSYGSDKITYFKCPDCGCKKKMKISAFVKYGFNCQVCGNNTSYPERVMRLLLIRLINYNFIKEYTVYINNERKRYDFYFEYKGNKYIIETHGIQHYKENLDFNKTLKEQQENDKIKMNYAINNIVKTENYIVIDCRYSNIKWIKNNILKSKLNEIFDLSDINWNKIDKMTQKSTIKEVCNYWHLHREINNEKITPKDLGIIFNLSKTTIRLYLNKGNKFKWCNYNGREESNKNIKYILKTK